MGRWRRRPRTADTGTMRRYKEQLDRLLRGPAGGMFACLLLAATLGGVAVAGPGGAMFAPSGGSSAGPGAAAAAVAEHANARERAGSADLEHGEYDVRDCRRVVRHLEGDLAAGDHVGLMQAITVVLDRCERHIQAPGLLRALDRLEANHERQLARDEARAAGEVGATGAAPGQAGAAPGHTGAAPGHDGGVPGSPGSAPRADAKAPAPAASQEGTSQGGGPQG